MSETLQHPTAPRTPPSLIRAWMRISPSLIPFLAVATAFLVGIPLMMLTQGSVIKGLHTSGVAYSALIEGMTGLVINDVVSLDNFENVINYSKATEISKDGLSRQARPIERVDTFGVDNIATYERVLSQYNTLTVDDIDLIGANLNAMREIGADRIHATGNLIRTLDEAGLKRADVKKLTTLTARKTSLSPEQLQQASALWAGIAQLDAPTLSQTLEYLNLMNTYTAQSMTDFDGILTHFNELGIELYSADASTLRDIATNDAKKVVESIETLKMLNSAGVTDPLRLGEEMRLLDNLYTQNLLTASTVAESLNGEVQALFTKDLIVRRPGDNTLVGKDMGAQWFGTLYDSQNQPVLYARLGGSVLLFIPGQLEATILKSIPYIIIGVAVGLGFIAGVFNIGAEGQLHMGAIAAAWIGFTITGLPTPLHVALVLFAGLIGGLLWGTIPGLLKAFTGASEVVVTIMLNFIAALFIDYLIKADPPILRDVTSTIPRTPPIEQSAHLLTFVNIPSWGFILMGLMVFGFLLWGVRKNINATTLRRPIVLGVVVTVLGFFMQAISVTGRLHIGLIFMVIVVFGVDWFLQRTTPGFELRTVGLNQAAAKYSGMNVALNVVLAMAISGMLAGFAGAIEVSGKEFAMVPNLFAGYGFDSISVALLARKNPRNMIWSGLLWGGLLSASGLMQIRADVSTDLVKIIQALIIMFVAADQIIRFLYRVPKNSDESKLIFSAK